MEKLGDLVDRLARRWTAFHACEEGADKAKALSDIIIAKEKLNNFEFELPEKSAKKQEAFINLYITENGIYNFSDFRETVQEAREGAAFIKEYTYEVSSVKTYKVTFNPHPVFELVEE